MSARILLDNFFLILQAAVSALMPVLVMPALVRTLGLETFGKLAVALAWATIGASIVQYAFHLTGPRRIAQQTADDSAGRAFWDIWSAKLLLLALVLPALVAAGLLTLPADTRGASLWLLAGLPLGAMFNSVWLLQSKGRFLSGVILTIAGTLIAVTIAFAAIANGSLSPAVAAICLVAGPIVSGVATFLAACRLVGAPVSRLSGTRAVVEIRTGFPLFSSQFIASVYGSAGPIVIGQLAGSAAAGSYTAVERLVGALSAGCLLTHTAAYPRLARTYHRDRSAYLAMVRNALTVMLVLALGAAIVVWVARGVVNEVLFGGALADSEPLLAWALVWLVISVFGLTLTGYFTVSGKTSRIMPLTMQVLGAALSAGIPAVLWFGAAGWMAALVLSQLIVVGTAVMYWRRENAG